MKQRSVFSFLEKSARDFPHRPALISKNKTTSYKELLAQAGNLASFLIPQTTIGEYCAIYMENSDSWVVSYFGVLGAGLIAVPLSLRSSDEHLAYQVGLTKPRFIITSEKYIPKMERFMYEHALSIPLITKKEYEQTTSAHVGTPRTADFVSILFTSGTTANQKAVRLTHEVVCSATRNIIEYFNFTHEDIHYCLLPLYHSFGLGNMHAMIAAGGTTMISNVGTNIKKGLEEIVSYKVTYLAATPLTLELMITHTTEEFIKTGTVLKTICTNTGPMPAPVTKKILALLPETQFHTYYGLTEASRSSFQHYNIYPQKLESVGFPAPHVSIKIVDDEGKELPRGEIGEVVIQGKHVVSEYWQNPELSKERFKKGWFYTNDAGLIDEEGFLFIKGRKDDMVDIGGERMSLQEIDRVLCLVPGITDAAVAVILGQSEQEKRLVAFIVSEKKISTKNEQSFQDKFMKILKTKLDRHQVPSSLIFVNEIPKTESGKIKRNQLQALYDSQS